MHDADWRLDGRVVVSAARAPIISDRAGLSRTGDARFRAPRSVGGGAVAAVLLGVPAAVAASVTTFVAGGGLAGALVAYVVVGMFALMTGGLFLARPRRLARLAGGALAQLCAGAPAAAQPLGR